MPAKGKRIQGRRKLEDEQLPITFPQFLEYGASKKNGARGSLPVNTERQTPAEQRWKSFSARPKGGLDVARGSGRYAVDATDARQVPGGEQCSLTGSFWFHPR